MDKYLNRYQAGQVLAESLLAYANRKDVVVLGLPRGGVPVAYEVAVRLNAPLDVFIVRKLGVPGHVELAMGAIANGNVQVFNQDVVSSTRVSQEEIQAVIKKEEQELHRREKLYRGGHDFTHLKNKIVILIDDGIATGATVRAAITAIRKLQPSQLILAVPVAQKDVCNELQHNVDTLVCPMRPEDFYAVGAWYEDFSQTEDEEVHQLLKAATK